MKMGPQLRDANAKDGRHVSEALKEGYQMPLKVLKRRTRSSVKIIHSPPNKGSPSVTPSKVITKQFEKMGLEVEGMEMDENVDSGVCTLRRSARHLRNSKRYRYSPSSPERQNSLKTKPASLPRRRSMAPVRMTALRQVTEERSARCERTRENIIDGEKVDVKRPIIKLKLVKQAACNFHEYRIVQEDSSPKHNESVTSRRSSRKHLPKVLSDEDYSESSSSETSEEDTSGSEELSIASQIRCHPPKSTRSTKVVRAINKRLFDSPMKGEFNTSTAQHKNERKSDTLEAVRLRLHTSQLPEHLPCRENEFEQICAFVKQSIRKDALCRSMYISGVPGTGKTATVIQAIRQLKLSKDCADFDFIMVNGMEVADPKEIFFEIYIQLFNVKKKIAANTARQKLNNIFQSFDKSRRPLVLLVDELDLLCTKRQDVVYDIFNWSSNEESRVSVLAIANTLDLPERLLSRRVGSRLGLNRMCFQPYDHDEISSIIKDRLCGSAAVEEDAVELASRKVASVSGDLRKALDILRRAAQIAIDSKSKRLSMKHVQEAVKEASTTASVELVRSLSVHSELILRAALAEHASSGLDELPFSDLLKQYRLQCHVAKLPPLPMSSAYRNAMELCSMHLLAAAPGINAFSRRFRLGMTAYEAKFALKQTAIQVS
uniref:Origin recognition complex subunit 1 n=3 Tax=Parascaris univalens TaxID=6257 RepID=A0A915B4S4_PARUN